MSGVDVPYHLRPNKYVDRQIFIDLLHKIDRISPLSKSVYVSMGGKFLDDHRAIRYEFDVRGSVSIEKFAHVIDRQIFNKPFENVECLHKDSRDFVNDFSQFRAAYPQETQFIVWLDYVDPADRLSQLEEFSTLIGFGRPMDLFRITLNANAETIVGSNKSKPSHFKTITEWRAAVFSSQMSKFYKGASPADMTAQAFPKVLAKTVGIAALEGAKGRPFVVKPLSVTSYSDGHRMLSITAILLPKDDAEVEYTWIENWPHLVDDWDDVVQIDVPDLSLKEKTLIDRHLEADNNDIRERLGFDLGQDETSSLTKISQYRKHFRFYPQFIRMA